MTTAQVADAEIRRLREMVASLEAQVAWLKKQLYGGGKGEKLDRAQLLLELGKMEELLRHTRDEKQTITYERSQAPKGVRPAPAEAFAHLPVRETVVIELPEVEADPDLYERIGEEETFEVDIDPPKLFKRRFLFPKYRHRLNRLRAPVLAPAPKRAVPGGYASAGLVAWIVLSKYVDHLPLCRQEKMSPRWGARLSRKSMVEWVRLAAEWLEILYKLMHRKLLDGGYVQADETPIRCRDPDHPRGKTFQGYLWVISRPGGDVLFEWKQSRRHGELSSLLQGYQGLLQADGYEAYASWEQKHDGVTLFGCWAHCRRKFVEALEESPQPAHFILRLISQLYTREKQWDQAGVGPRYRTHLRQRDFPMTLGLLEKAAKKLARRARPTSALGKACKYLLNQWDLLVRIRDHGHGRVRLDNNLVENAIRPSAIGKRNWLFIGHPDAGQRSAIIYSIVVSCQRHQVDPCLYLRDVLTRLPAMSNQEDLTPLLPENWKQLQ